MSPGTSPEAQELYSKLVETLDAIGPFHEEITETSVQLVRDSAFVGVRPLKHHLVVTVKSDRPIESPRIAKAEPVSYDRWHLEIKIADATDIDDELIVWMRTAYGLCGRDV